MTQKKRKKFGLFYGSVFSLLLIAFIVLFYFIILVSTTPKSFPFVTYKIEEILQKKFGVNNVGLANSYISFTRYGTLKVAATSLKIIYGDKAEKQVFIIPRVESEFSLLNFFLLRFQPIKIKLTNPNIVIDDLQKFQPAQTDEVINKPSHLSLITGLLSSISKGDNPIENFEIENAKLLIRSPKFATEILLKKSQIKATTKNKILNISAQNQISFDANKGDVNLDSNCRFSGHDDNLKCDLFLKNFIPDSISALHPKLSHLGKISASFNANVSLEVKDREIKNVAFKIKAEKGNFEFLDFFGHKMDFSSFSASGDYYSKLNILNLSEIETDFASNLAEMNSAAKPHLSMSLIISGLFEEQNRFDFYIKLRNVFNDELEKFWPASLEAEGSRAWVIEHIKGGLIKNAYAKFSLIFDDKKNHLGHLAKMDSEVIFSGLNLNYSSDFPAITDLSGIAGFTQDGMKITVYGGNVLNSKISDGLVAIDDFSAKKVILKIAGKLAGHAADGLKHANNSPEFFTTVEKFLNGNAQSDFEVRIPLSDKITLKNSYIAANSTVVGVNNEYVSGGVIIHVKKDVSSFNFITDLDLTAAELLAKTFGVTKKSQTESALSFVVDTRNAEKILIKNINLWRKEEKDQRPAIITGSTSFETSPFAISAINLSNRNFGGNDYSLFYSFDSKNSAQKIFIKGQKFNFIPATWQKSNRDSFDVASRQIQVSLNRVDMLRGKFLRNFHLSANCVNGICYKASARANYSKQKILNLQANKLPKKNFATIEGRVGDIGYLTRPSIVAKF